MTKLCYDCLNFLDFSLKCRIKNSYVYTPTKAEHCHSFVRRTDPHLIITSEHESAVLVEEAGGARGKQP